jgi:hypothetical protein
MGFICPLSIPGKEFKELIEKYRLRRKLPE